ncbi:MAG TPA: XRE family transcriptional regulator [candidate division Zixibacteria bacterium]|nr:XRE family transcriptional regulator [candidate division Zixibacteria bacterium]
MKKNIRLLRVASRMSQWELSKLSGIPQSKISLYENDLIDLSDEERKRLHEAIDLQNNRG